MSLALAGLLVGLGVAPVLVSCYSLAERAAPAGWGATMMTALATANVSGVAAGAAIAGQLVDRATPAVALLVVSVAGAVITVAGRAAGRRTPITGGRRPPSPMTPPTTPPRGGSHGPRPRRRTPSGSTSA